jgi:hypothetical protein
MAILGTLRASQIHPKQEYDSLQNAVVYAYVWMGSFLEKEAIVKMTSKLQLELKNHHDESFADRETVCFLLQSATTADTKAHLPSHQGSFFGDGMDLQNTRQH